MELLEKEPAEPLWHRRHTLFLVATGLVLAVVSFWIVMLIPNPIWHPGRDAELNATFEAFKETGILLIKHAGAGWTFAGETGGSGFVPAVWDDDPGAYIAASVTGAVFGLGSPYPGLKVLVGVIVAAPLLWLPFAFAKMFKTPVAGYFMIAAPLVFWLANSRSGLVGTQYGMSDSVSTLPVYALYGLASALVFLGLSLVLLFANLRLSFTWLIGVSLGVAVLAGVSNLTRSLSGVGVALAVGVLWWLNWRFKRKWLVAIAASLMALTVAVGVQSGIMRTLNETRASALDVPVSELPVSHGTWHPLYLGLSYPQPISGEESSLAIVWADEFGLTQAQKVNPKVVFGTAEYDAIIRELFLEQVTEHPVAVMKIYVQKFFYTLQHFGGLLLVIMIAFLLAFRKRSRTNKLFGVSIAIVTPTLLIGLLPTVLVMPMLYFMSELYAGISILVLTGLGAIGWMYSQKPENQSGYPLGSERPELIEHEI